MPNEDLKRHKLAGSIVWIYIILKGNRRRSIARLCFDLLFRLEGGHYRSATVRELMARDYDVVVGAHSYGEVFNPGAFAPTVVVGKYVSIGKGVKVVTQNHPTNHSSTHPYFYERQFGFIEKDILTPATTHIGSDVWIGHNALILPGCNSIGHGAIIGAGAVVTKPVPDYAVVAGNPAKLIKYRFPQSTIQKLLSDKWWDKPIDYVAEHAEQMCRPER